MSISEKVSEFVNKAEEYSDAEFRKAMKEIVRLFHNDTHDEQIDESAPATEAPPVEESEQPAGTAESLEHVDDMSAGGDPFQSDDVPQ